MWLAHALSLSRIPIASALVAAYGQPAWAVTLIAVAALTDTLDGNVARWVQRRGHTRPAIGGWLDPLVDKLFVVIVLAILAYHSGDLVVLALIGARELLLVPLAAVWVARHRPLDDLHADPIGKAATVAQFIAIAIAVGLPAYALPAAAVTAVIGVAAAVHYVARFVNAPASARLGRETS